MTNPAHKAWETRRARRANFAAIEPVVGSFEDGAAVAMADADLLSSLIGGRRSVAADLIARCGSFAETMAAPRAMLADIDAAAASAIELVRAAMTRTLRGEIKRKTALSSWSAVVDYLRLTMGFDAVETFRVLFLDKRNQLIADETLGRGTVDNVPVYPREVAKRALQLDATALVIAHNHPSGDPTPSRADIDMTRQLVEALKPLGIALHDHVIVGRDGHASLKQAGLM